MKVVIPVGDLKKGGGTRVLAGLANALVKHGHRVDVVMPQGAPLDYKLTANLVQVPGLAAEHIPYGDVVLANFYITFAPSYAAWPSQCVRLCQGFEPLWVPDPDYALWTYAQDVPIVSVSHQLDNQIFEALGKRSHVQTIGVNRKVFHPKGPKKHHRRKTILYIARDPDAGYRMKGFHDFVRAMRHFQHSYKEPYMVDLVCPERPLSLGDTILHRVVQPKSDHELARLYRRADVFVSTSRIEGFGLPPLEAMASGTPVVTTDSGGVRDFCTHQETAYVVEPRKTHRIAHGIRRVLEDQSLRDRLVQNGLQQARHFDERSQYRRMIRLLETIANNR